MQTDFSTVTELANAPISLEQLDRLVNRYMWAASHSKARDVVEAACGAGPGLGVLAEVARSVEAGDCSPAILEFARRQYSDRLSLREFDAQAMPFADGSKDVIILFEAIYYLPDPECFVSECARVLRPAGSILLSSANKDLWDFHPSPFSHNYFGVVELGRLFGRHGFQCEFFGFQPVNRSPLRQRILRPIKRAAVISGLMPKTMSGKRWLKRIVFGRQVAMPAQITSDTGRYVPPQPIAAGEANRLYKVIYCAAQRTPPPREVAANGSN